MHGNKRHTCPAVMLARMPRQVLGILRFRGLISPTCAIRYRSDYEQYGCELRVGRMDQPYLSGHSSAAGTPSFRDIADSIRCDRRCPWLTIVTVEGLTPKSRATDASELPANLSLVLIHSCFCCASCMRSW
jgi:hypothetical protein